MQYRSFTKLAAAILAASAAFAAACSDAGPVAPLQSSSSTVKVSPTLNHVVTTTVWDFVQLAGTDGALGTPKSFTIAGSGTIVTSTTTIADPQTQVWAKGFADPPGTDERGLGICREIGTGGECDSGDDEIGDSYPDQAHPSLILDFTGLTPGSVVTGVTLSSVQETEGYSIEESSDGVAYTLLASGVGVDPNSAVVSIDVPAGVKFLRFDVGPGGAGNNYLVQTVTVVNTTITGKTFSIGPSSMEGAILIANGDWVNGGYSFKFDNGTHIATNYSVHATVSLTGPCIGGGPSSDTFTFPLNDATYAVSANNTNWLPTGDQNSVLSWQGSVVAAGVCGGIGKLDARHGAVFTATVSQNPPTGSLVDFRFKYRDPAAKGKPNTNCLNTADPNRAKADVCGASWSQTVRDP